MPNWHMTQYCHMTTVEQNAWQMTGLVVPYTQGDCITPKHVFETLEKDLQVGLGLDWVWRSCSRDMDGAFKM